MKFNPPSSPPQGFLNCSGLNPRFFRAFVSARVIDDSIAEALPPDSSDSHTKARCLYVREEFSRAACFSSPACSKATKRSNRPVLAFFEIFCSRGHSTCRLHCRILHLPGMDEDEGGVFHNPSAPPWLASDQQRAASQAAAKLVQLPSTCSHCRFWPRRTRWAAASIGKWRQTGIGRFFLIRY